MSSDIKSICRTQYAARIALRQDIPSELKRALRAHERVPLFIDNLAKQLYHVPKRVKLETIIEIVHDMTDIFIASLMRKHDEQSMSSLERQRILADETKKATIRAWADEFVGEEKVTRNAEGHEVSSEVIRIQ